ncbi:MAG: DNA-directed RNA polymerase subunit H [Candidatus Bathyarchaeota archaeon]|nr:MAG: DNA-directed RNA polymerase subunit H [Candidatus Bathyarchaeota archaeon]
MVERKAQVLIKLRGYKRQKRIELKNAIGYYVTAPEGKALIFCVLEEGTVGVAYVNQLLKIIEGEQLKKAIIVIGGRYTQAAKKKATVNHIELIPQIFPAFNLFEHELVPKHEILSTEERETLLEKYRSEPYQLPRIKLSDPAILAIGAKPGDIVKIIRKSPTAGEHLAYRYVVPD